MGGKLTKVRMGELGTNCWLPQRFVGGRCDRVLHCKYPERKTCKAVASEIEFLQQNRREIIEQMERTTAEKLEQLREK